MFAEFENRSPIFVSFRRFPFYHCVMQAFMNKFHAWFQFFVKIFMSLRVFLEVRIYFLS